MNTDTEQFVAANQAAVDALMAVASTALASAERITNLNLSAARAALEDTASSTRAVMAAKDPQAALSAQTALVQPNIERATDYSRSLYAISAQTQQEMSKLFEAQLGAFQQTFVGMFQQAAKAAPAGYEHIAPLQNAIAAASAAFANLNNIGKQFAEGAQANIDAFTKATTRK